MDLPADICDEIDDLAAQGDDLCDESKFEKAIEKWSAAMALLPEPRVDWEAYTWLSASIGDAQYQLGQLDAARHSFYDALNGPDGPGNPFVHYRLGQILIKLADEDRGTQSLLKAYMLDGNAVFSADPDGLIYLQKLRDTKLID
jgi:tetratricopeptide (TPR) repeat protein